MTYQKPFAFLISLFMAVFMLLSSNVIASESNTPIPKFNIPTLTKGKYLSNKAFHGHVTLLNVWASWCGYCRSEHKMLLSIKKTVPIYGLDYKDNPESAQEWLNQAGNPYVLVGVDESGEVGNLLGVSGTPKTYVIDKHGRIRYEYTGGIDKSGWQDELLPIIKKYQNEA